jgi:drug/metabolite transporter (DMT)-like permease
VTTALAIYAALAWALSDYFGAHYSRKLKSPTLTFYAQVLSLLIIIPLAVAVGGSTSWNVLLYGVAAGCLNVMSFCLLMEGTRRGRIGAVIPTSAVVNAILPISFGLLTGDVLSGFALAGIALAVTGTALSASEVSGTESWRRSFDKEGLFFGICSGIGFGVMFILLGQTGKDAGIWPVVAMRLAIPLLLPVARWSEAPLRPSRLTLKAGVCIAITGSTALAAFTLASHTGPLSVVATIAATSPAGSVVIAHLLHTERTTKMQMLGVALAVAGTVTLALR